MAVRSGGAMGMPIGVAVSVRIAGLRRGQRLANRRRGQCRRRFGRGNAGQAFEIVAFDARRITCGAQRIRSLLTCFTQARERARRLFGGPARCCIDFCIRLARAIKRGGDRALQRIARRGCRSRGHFAGANSSVHGAAGLFELVLDAGDREGKRFGAGCSFTRETVERLEPSGEVIPGAGH